MQPPQWHTRGARLTRRAQASRACDHTANEVNLLKLPGAGNHPQLATVWAECSLIARHAHAAYLVAGLGIDQSYLVSSRTERGQPSVGQCVELGHATPR